MRNEEFANFASSFINIVNVRTYMLYHPMRVITAGNKS